MNYNGIEHFIKTHLRYKQHWKKKIILMSDAVWQTSEDDTSLGNCSYAKGSQFKVFETQNFGWVVFAPGTKTPSGDEPNRCIHKW